MGKKVTKIPATINGMVIEDNTISIKKRNVAGYARVSTNNEEQLSSYEAQLDYYEKYINSRIDWNYVGMYADEGLSATSTKKRDDFNRMVEDALNGKIDLILTKSVSRFARNTVDSLTIVRKLKDKGVEIYFEKENIWTLDAKGELLITIMSSLAQEESRSISENTKWGRRKSFADGKVSVAYTRFMGYEKDFEVNEEQAVIVRLIYKMFLSGYTCKSIARYLSEQGVKTVSGKPTWSADTIISILKNEKYKGDALLQKTFVKDFLTKKSVVNNGELPQYYVKGHHEPIIEPGVFEQAQLELQRRGHARNKWCGILTYKVRCGECGDSYYSPRVWNSNNKYRKIVWQCSHRYTTRKEDRCHTPAVSEDKVKELFVRALNELLANKNSVIADLYVLKGIASNTDDIEERKELLKVEMDEMHDTSKEIVASMTRNVERHYEYEQEYSDLMKKYIEKENEYKRLEEKIVEMKARGKSIQEFIDMVEQREGLLTEFDEKLWAGLLDEITIYSKERIEIKFKTGYVTTTSLD